MSASPQEIAEHIKGLEKEQQDTIKYISDMCVALEGVISYSEAWEISYAEREALVKSFNKKIKEMKKALK